MPFVRKSIKGAELYNENFNHYFTEKLNAITQPQRSMLPDDLAFKVYRWGTEASAGRLNFNEKMWMLENVFGCSITIVAADEENGIGIDAFKDAQKAQKGKMANSGVLEKLRTHAAFILGGKELMASLLYMSYISCSGIYTLLKNHVPNANHNKNKKFADEKKAFNKTISFMVNYEANKKRIAMDYGLNMPEWYALLYFARNEEFGINFYNRDLIYAYNSDKGNLFRGVQRIHQLGYLIKRRAENKDRYIISSKGMELLNRIFNNVLLKI